MPKIQLDMGEELSAKLDELAMRNVKKVIPRGDWLCRTLEGRRFWGQQQTKTHLTAIQMNAEIDAAWRKATGGPTVGRPSLMSERVRVIEEALGLYEKTLPPAEKPAELLSTSFRINR